MWAHQAPGPPRHETPTASPSPPSPAHSLPPPPANPSPGLGYHQAGPRLAPSQGILNPRARPQPPISHPPGDPAHHEPVYPHLSTPSGHTLNAAPPRPRAWYSKRLALGTPKDFMPLVLPRKVPCPWYSQKGFVPWYSQEGFVPLVLPGRFRAPGTLRKVPCPWYSQKGSVPLVFSIRFRALSEVLYRRTGSRLGPCLCRGVKLGLPSPLRRCWTLSFLSPSLGKGSAGPTPGRGALFGLRKDRGFGCAHARGRGALFGLVPRHLPLTGAVLDFFFFLHSPSPGAPGTLGAGSPQTCGARKERGDHHPAAPQPFHERLCSPTEAGYPGPTEDPRRYGIVTARRDSDLEAFSHNPTDGHLRYRLTGVPPQSNSPPATVPRAGHARQGRALDARSESPLGARLPASPDSSRIPLVRTSSKSAARRQPRRPAGGPRERVPAGAVAGEIREKGPARVQSRRRRPPYPVPSTGPPSTRRRTPPRENPRPATREAPRTRAPRGGPRTALPAAERGGRRGDCSPSRGSSPATLRTPARPTQPLEPILIPKLRI
ncbi:tripartite motif-containing protein 65-like protein [Lates japonicus]|uniref:Tripartite motif-containing protein 65-like protein n=1 Tax=Lates japonicus TaxID=270547 RepID=A0AAD3NFW1_LATJO|nr:tripartite motif-containing protein 65-like protein [Lates japonicus]